MVKKKFYWLLLFLSLFVLLVFIVRMNFIGKSFDYKNDSLLISNPEWQKEVGGEGDDKNVVLLVEFDKSLCQKRMWCGFMEHEGKFEDVAKAVSYMREMLGGVIKVNMDFDENGDYASLDSKRMKTITFDDKVPVRFIYFDGDDYKFPLQANGFSQGWGVDPKTSGLVVYFGSESTQTSDYLDSAILATFLDMTNVVKGVNVVDRFSYNEILELWFGGELERADMAPSEGATLKLIYHDE